MDMEVQEKWVMNLPWSISNEPVSDNPLFLHTVNTNPSKPYCRYMEGKQVEVFNVTINGHDLM